MVISNRPIKCEEILARFPQFFVEFAGDLTRSFTAIASPDTATPENAVFLANPKVISKGLESSAAVLIVPRKAFAQIKESVGNRTLLAATNVELAMASVINEFFLPTPYTNRAIKNVHPTAVIATDAELDPSVRVGPHAFIGSKVQIAKNVYIGAGTVIEDETRIGAGTVIHPNVFIGHNVEIGQRCEIHPSSVIGKEGFGYAHDERGNHYRIPHQGRVVIEDDVHIGASCTIDRGTFGETRVEFGCKLDNQVHIAHNCRIGRNSLLTAGFMVAGSSRIGANFVAGGRSVVTGHIEICDNVQIGGLSGVQRSITEPGQYGGFPILPLQHSLRIRAAMNHLPEMRKQLAQVLKKLDLSNPGDSQTDGPTPEA